MVNRWNIPDNGDFMKFLEMVFAGENWVVSALLEKDSFFCVRVVGG